MGEQTKERGEKMIRYAVDLFTQRKEYISPDSSQVTGSIYIHFNRRKCYTGATG